MSPLNRNFMGNHSLVFFSRTKEVKWKQTRPGLEPTTSRTAGKHANHKTTEAFENKKVCYIYLSRTMGAMVETYNK
jgi:hypothetical protein